jgi:hypothetical protein
MPENPANFRHLMTSQMGVKWSMGRDENGKRAYYATGMTDDVLDTNKAIHNHGAHHNQEKDRYLAASIPPIIVVKWLNEEGLNVYNPEHSDRLRKKLDDPAWQHLRIWKGRLGKTHRDGS